MSTEVGSSSIPNRSGDLALDIITMFESWKQQFPIGCLISVPDHLRKLDEQAFTPRLISIGPIHRSNAKLQTMKKCKVHFCECFNQRANINLQHVIYNIRVREKEIRSCYAETIVSSISSDDFVTMILVDGMFILEYFLRQSNPHLGEYDLMIAEWMHPILKFDLVLLENQLPFFVLEMLFEQVNIDLKLYSLRELAFKFFECYNFQRMAFEQFCTNIEHFTDLVRLFYLGERIADRRFGGAKLSYSATQLHEAGVKLKGIEFDETMGRFYDKRQRMMRHNRSHRCFIDVRYLLHEVVDMLHAVVDKLRGVEYDERMEFDRMFRYFLDIRFDLNNGVLEIPCIKLNDERVHLIRNIIALEQSHYVGHAYVTDFFVILDFLVDNSKDVDLLCDKGILVNYLGDSNAAASAINNLNSNILWDYMNLEYSKICAELNAFYKKPCNRWRTTLWRQYFSTPWRAVSTSAAIILLVLTAIQAVCSLKSTKW